jgi:hypothetical protein
MKVQNPYYDEAASLIELPYVPNQRSLQYKYAWSIPTAEHAIAIAGYGIKEITDWGAGTGYWAWYLAQSGLRITAFDDKSWSAHADEASWVTIHDAKRVKQITTEALMLCWPPYDEPMAFEALKMFAGEYLIYVGEGYGGCTGDDDFHKELQNWLHLCHRAQPNWWGIHSAFNIYKRS